jgi:outer membrane protein assembly factor BamB
MTSRNAAPLLAIPAVLAAGLLALSADKPRPAAKEPRPAETDMLATVKDWNSDRYAAPPTTFRAGHVTTRALDEKAITRAKDGFVVKLPSGAPVPTPSVYRGKLYVSGGFHSKEFYCLDASTGKPVWGVNLDDDGPTSAACQDGVIVFNTESCTIFALDAGTGKQLWSLWLGDPLTSTPTIANGKVFTAYPAAGHGGPNLAPVDPKAAKGGRAAPPCSHALAAFDLKTGKILWQRWIDSDVMSAPVAVDRELYVASFAGVVYKLDQADGTIRSAVRSRATSAPVVVGDKVYFTRRADVGKEDVSESTGASDRHTLRGRYTGPKKSAPYLDKDVQARGALKVHAGALDASNGFAGGPPPAANPVAAEGNVGQSNVSSMQAFQGSRILNDGDNNISCMGDEVVCTDAASGKRRWSVRLEGDLKRKAASSRRRPRRPADGCSWPRWRARCCRWTPSRARSPPATRWARRCDISR